MEIKRDSRVNFPRHDVPRAFSPALSSPMDNLSPSSPARPHRGRHVALAQRRSCPIYDSAASTGRIFSGGVLGICRAGVPVALSKSSSFRLEPESITVYFELSRRISSIASSESLDAIGAKRKFQLKSQRAVMASRCACVRACFAQICAGLILSARYSLDFGFLVFYFASLSKWYCTTISWHNSAAFSIASISSAYLRQIRYCHS